MSRRILAVVHDLFFVAKLQEGARHAGVQLELAAGAEDLLEKAKAGADLIVIDVSETNLEALEAVRRVRESSIGSAVPIFGFVSHVRADLVERARAAGCDRVIARSQFTAKLVDFLKGD